MAEAVVGFGGGCMLYCSVETETMRIDVASCGEKGAPMKMHSRNIVSSIAAVCAKTRT